MALAAAMARGKGAERCPDPTPLQPGRLGRDSPPSQDSRSLQSRGRFIQFVSELTDLLTGATPSTPCAHWMPWAQQQTNIARSSSLAGPSQWVPARMTYDILTNTHSSDEPEEHRTWLRAPWMAAGVRVCGLLVATAA